MEMISTDTALSVLTGLFLIVAGLFTKHLAGIGIACLLGSFSVLVGVTESIGPLNPSISVDPNLSNSTSTILGSSLSSNSICRFEISDRTQTVTFYKECDYLFKESAPNITLLSNPFPELPAKSITAIYSSTDNAWEVSGRPLRAWPTVDEYQQRIDNYLSFVASRSTEARKHFELRENSSRPITAMSF